MFNLQVVSMLIGAHRVPVLIFALGVAIAQCQPGLAGPCLLQAQEADGQLLQWKFKQGDQFRIELDQKARSESEVIRRRVKIVNRVQMNVLWEVAEVDAEGVAKIVQVIESVKMSLTNTNPEGNVTEFVVDTEAEAPQEKVARKMLAELQPVLGQKVFFRMTPRGEIKDFELPDETLDALRDAANSMEIRKIFSGEGMQDLLGPSAVVLPADPVAAGDTWTTTRKLQIAAGNYTQNFNYSVQQLGSPARIDVNCELVADAAPAVSESADNKTEIVEQSGTGQLQFDTQAGYLSSSSFKSVVETRTGYREMDIEVTTTDETIFSIEKVN